MDSGKGRWSRGNQRERASIQTVATETAPDCRLRLRYQNQYFAAVAPAPAWGKSGAGADFSQKNAENEAAPYLLVAGARRYPPPHLHLFRVNAGVGPMPFLS